MRAAGVILHISSLPSPYGVGTLGKAAFDFVDFLQESGMKYWQILPMRVMCIAFVQSRIKAENLL